jgi:hypothetical protein
MKLYLAFHPVATGIVLGKQTYEQTIVYAQSENRRGEPYPAFMTHIDTFWDGSGDNTLYRELLEGNVARAVAEIEVIDGN